MSTKNLLSSNISSTCPYNMANFGPLTAEIGSGVWGTPANFNGFRILAALLYGTLVVGISQTLRHWTEGTTYIQQGDHHAGHWSTFLFVFTLFQFWRSIRHMIIWRVSTQGSAFWGLRWDCCPFKGSNPQNPNFWGVNRRFQA